MIRLRDDCDDSEKRTNEAVLKDANPDNVEPRQTTLWLPQKALGFAASALLHPVHWPNPILWFDIPEVLFLFVKIGRNVVTHECEKAGDGEGLITVSQHFKIYGVLVVYV